jgi:hypothetical protein
MKLGLKVASGAVMLALSACGRSGGGSAPVAVPTAPPPAQASDPGYIAAPQIVGLAHAADGALALIGRSPASSQVHLASPSGVRLETTADGNGDWRAPLGPVTEPILYGLSAETQGRRIQAEGYVAVLPGAAPTVALLRAGSGAQVLDGAAPALRLLALDIDGGGTTVVSGRALAAEPVRLLVDGAPAIEVAAGADGRFSATLPKALTPGVHHIEAASGRAKAAASITSAPVAPFPDGPYRATPDKEGWRIDWMTPGGGPQTTLVLSTPGPAQ